MAKTLRCLDDHKDFFLSHDLSGIPLSFQVNMGVVCDEQEIIEKNRAMPFRMNETILSPQGQRQEFPGGLLDPGPRASNDCGQRSQGGRAPAMELRCYNHVNMHLIVTDSHLFLALPRLNAIDYYATLCS